MDTDTSKWMTKDWTQGDLNAVVKKIGGEDVGRGILDDSLVFKIEKPAKPPLLRSLTTISVKGTERFVAKDAFQIHTDPGQRVRISHLGENFKKLFLPKVEDDVPDATLGVHELLEDSRDMRIVAELGYEEGVEIFLAHFYETLAAKQAAGDFTWTVGYARDKDGNLCPVIACPLGDGWDVGARFLGSPVRWFGGDRFLSRNS